MLSNIKRELKKTAMKKIVLSIVAIAIMATATAQVKEISNWSVGVKGGISTVRGIQYSGDFDRAYNPVFGAFAERTFSPLFGLGFEYLYQGNNAKGDINGNTLTPVDFKSTLHNVGLYSSVNITNVLGKYRKNQKFNAYGIFGLGAGIGSYTDNLASVSESGKLSLASSFGVNFELDVTKDVAVGLEGAYKWNSNGAFNPSGVKDFYTAQLVVRYKLGGVTNPRNSSQIAYEQIKSGAKSEKDAIAKLQYELSLQAEEIAKLKARSPGDSIDGVAVKDIIMGLQYQIDKLSNLNNKVRKDFYKHLAASGEDSLSMDADKFGFETGSAKLKADAKAFLDNLANDLNANPAWTVKVAGHTDNVGSEGINQVLSIKRAESVKAYLASKGVAAERIAAEGFGLSKPLVCNDTEEGKSKNRRVEIIIVK